MTKIEHIGIAVKDLEISELIFSKIFNTAPYKREEVISEIATFVQSKTPEVLPLFEIQKKYPTSYEESMNTVLVQ